MTSLAQFRVTATVVMTSAALIKKKAHDGHLILNMDGIEDFMVGRDAMRG